MTAPHRSASMDALRRNVLAWRPGMTIYWIGDAAHAATVSGHNPDDTPGVRAELADADDDPEVRSLDFMLGPKFSTDDADALLDALLTPSSQARLYYVIYNRLIWSRSTGWLARPYTGTNPHTGHLHVSGWAADDANGADWPAILALKGTPMSAEEVLTALRTGQPYRDAGVAAAAAAADPQAPTQLSLRGLVELTYGAVAFGLNAANSEAVEALAGAVANLANQLADLRTLIETLPAGTIETVDTEAIAQRVADLLAERLQS